MFKRKVQTVGTVGDFMRTDDAKPRQAHVKRAGKAAAISAVPLMFAASGFKPAGAFAAGNSATVEAVPAGAISDAIKSRIMNAFDPLVELMISLSYPIAGVMLAGGSLAIMIGMRDKGYSMIQMAGVGYILVQMTPLFLDLLVGIGGAV